MYRKKPSILRGFSAPVKLDYSYTDDELGFLIAHDSDPFARWEANQRLAINVIKRLVQDVQAEKRLQIDEVLITAYRRMLERQEIDKALLAQLLEFKNGIVF